MGPDTPEADLVAGLVSGYRGAYFEAVRRFSGRMAALAQRMVGVNNRDDVVQDAWLSAVKAIGKFAGRSRLSTWLHQITANAALMFLRARKRRPEVLVGDAVVLDTRASLLSLLEPEDLQRLKVAMERLPDPFRAVVRMHDLEGIGLELVGSALGVGESTVKTRLHRGRLVLREILARPRTSSLHGLTSSPKMSVKTPRMISRRAGRKVAQRARRAVSVGWRAAVANLKAQDPELPFFERLVRSIGAGLLAMADSLAVRPMKKKPEVTEPVTTTKVEPAPGIVLEAERRGQRMAEGGAALKNPYTNVTMAAAWQRGVDRVTNNPTMFVATKTPQPVLIESHPPPPRVVFEDTPLGREAHVLPSSIPYVPPPAVVLAPPVVTKTVDAPPIPVPPTVEAEASRWGQFRRAAFNEGLAAQKTGSPLKANPYHGTRGIGGARHIGWAEGWNYGAGVTKA